MSNSTLPAIEAFLTAQFNKFNANEALFAHQEETAVVSALAKTHKDDLFKAVPSLLAKKQTKTRAAVVLSLLRQMEILPERFAGYSLTKDLMSPELSAALHGLSNLTSENSGNGASPYGAIALKTKQILDNSLMPPFAQRLDALKTELLSQSADLNSLSKQPNIAVSVDLLVLLMRDENVHVRKAALEVYIRRVYRAHCIKTLVIEETTVGRKAGDSLLSAHWSFSLRDTVDSKESPVRYGYMNMLSGFDQLETHLPGVLKRAASHLKKSSHLKEPLNVLHVGFTHTASDDENIASENKISNAISRTLAAHKPALAAMDVRAANVLLVNPSVMPLSTANSHNSNKRVGYFNFNSETGFQEDVVSRLVVILLSFYVVGSHDFM
jgi:hypothetical protein